MTLFEPGLTNGSVSLRAITSAARAVRDYLDRIRTFDVSRVAGDQSGPDQSRMTSPSPWPVSSRRRFAVKVLAVDAGGPGRADLLFESLGVRDLRVFTQPLGRSGLALSRQQRS